MDPDGFRALSDAEKRDVELEIKQILADNLLDTEQSPSTLTSQLSSNLSNTVAATTTISHGANKSLISNFNKSHKPTAMESFLDLIGDNRVPKSNYYQRSTIVEELYNYRLSVTKFNTKNQPSVSSCSYFWKRNSMNFPYLFQLVKQLLSTPATSVPSESAFSVSAYLARRERARLSGDKLAATIFLKVSGRNSMKAV